MISSALTLVLVQSPFDSVFPEEWFVIMGHIYNALFALAIRGYLLLLLAGMIVFATGLNDTLSKILVAFGIFLYFGGPFIVNVLANASSIELVTMESATAVWLEIFGVTDAELVYIFVWLGEAVAGICCLTGAILYFTPSTRELKSRGQSLIVRSLILAPFLVFFHMAPYLL